MMTTQTVQQRLDDMGIVLPPPPAPAGAYTRSVRSGNLVFVSGQLPMRDGEIVYSGHVGQDGLSTQEGAAAARQCAVNALAILAADVGNLEKVKIVRMTGYVASAQDFTEQAQVMNGASELMASILAQRGVHARIAVGVTRLPLNAAVELEVIAETD